MVRLRYCSCIPTMRRPNSGLVRHCICETSTFHAVVDSRYMSIFPRKIYHKLSRVSTRRSLIQFLVIWTRVLRSQGEGVLAWRLLSFWLTHSKDLAKIYRSEFFETKIARPTRVNSARNGLILSVLMAAIHMFRFCFLLGTKFFPQRLIWNVIISDWCESCFWMTRSIRQPSWFPIG